MIYGSSVTLNIRDVPLAALLWAAPRPAHWAGSAETMFSDMTITMQTQYTDMQDNLPPATGTSSYLCLVTGQAQPIISLLQ